nr:tRNA 5-hydroxyuridine modification protein YegQ [Sinobacterium caligoides]
MSKSDVFTPELLSPAGSLRNMRYAYAYGADAVYAGQPRYSLRVRNNEFNLANLEVGINEAHAAGKQFYVVSNIAPHNSKLKTFLKDVEPVIDLKPDALIMSDPGLIMMVREKWPDINIHLSVQANAVNWASVKFWQQMGLTRTILSRELSLDEIGQISQEVPGMELEVFVHGALCMAYSGRCLLSGYINKRDSNQGSCTNACRWKYDAHEAVETSSGNIIPATAVESWTPEDGIEPTLGAGEPTDQMYLLQESGRPDDYMPAFEDEHGTYIMNSKDLRALQHVPRLLEMGVKSLKIEGRTKSHYYVARTAQVYRKAIDDAVAGRDFDMAGMDNLEALANRGYTEGFYRRHVHDEYQNYERGNSLPTSQQFVGEVVDQDRQRGTVTIDVKNRFEVGDSVELMTPAGNRRFSLENIENKKGQSVDVAPGSGHIVTIPCPIDADANLGLLVRDL